MKELTPLVNLLTLKTQSETNLDVRSNYEQK